MTRYWKLVCDPKVVDDVEAECYENETIVIHDVGTDEIGNGEVWIETETETQDSLQSRFSEAGLTVRITKQEAWDMKPNLANTVDEALQNAVQIAGARGANYVGTEDLLASLAKDPRTMSYKILHKHGLTYRKIMKDLGTRLAKGAL
jgi:ATP-dependent Clp protease ATP-binding subunit ClpA